MQLKIKLLQSPYQAEMLPVHVPIVQKTTYTRKKSPHSKSPRNTDTVAWRWKGEHKVEEVFRSPIDGHEWVTRDQKNLLVGSLIYAEAVFTSRKGYQPIFQPKEGDRGWFRQHGESYRRLFQYDGSKWVLAHRDDSL